MKNYQKGIAPLIIIAIIALLAIGTGTWVYKGNSKVSETKNTNSTSTTVEDTVDTRTETKTSVAVKIETKNVLPAPAVSTAPKIVEQLPTTAKTCVIAYTNAEFEAQRASRIMGWWYVNQAQPVYKGPKADCPIIDSTEAQVAWYGVGDLNYVFALTTDGKPGNVLRKDLFLLGDDLAACSMPLRYSIGAITGKFAEKGYSKSDLAGVAQEAEMAWETAIGKELFTYVEAGALNIVNFGGLKAGSVAEPLGLATYNQVEDTFVINFDIDINDLTLTSVENENASEARNFILQTLTHEFGHVLGIKHLEGNNIMSSESGQVPIIKPTSADTEAARVACSRVHVGN